VKKIRLIEMVVSIAIFMLTLTCRAGLIISYKGLDNVHLQYEVEIEQKADVIKIVCSDGEEAIIGSLPEGGGKISGAKIHSGLTKGSYTFQLVIDGSNYGSPVSVEINGKIGGTLLYNDTINNIATLEKDVYVPKDKTLDIKNNIVGSPLCDFIYVYGTITFQSGVILNGVRIYFEGNPVNIDGIGGGGELIFYPKSSGSTVRNSKSKFLVTVQPNTSVSINKSEINNLQLLEKSSLFIEDSTVLSGWSIAKIEEFEAKNTTFLSTSINPIEIYGGSPKFDSCEFADLIILHNRNKGEFKNCVFGAELVFDNSSTDLPKWSEDSSITPTFSGNSFVGYGGPLFLGLNPPFIPIDLGINYYGDKAPVIGNMSRTFLTRGVEVNTFHFKVSDWNISGPEMKNQKKLPNIWRNDYIIGQNSLSYPSPWSGRKDHTPIQDKETLLSLDVATNYTNVSGVKFKAIFDGQEILPVNPNVVLHRDISGLSKDVFYGNTTVNFILPPTDKESVSLVVKMDTTGIQGFDEVPENEKGEKEILNLNLTFAPQYGRQLNILIQPVQLYIKGYSRSAPDGKSVEESLRKLIPAMLPISKQDLHIWTAPPTTFYGGLLSMLSTTALLNRIANSLSVEQGFINTTAAVGGWLSGKETAKIDFVVAVLPKGAMGEGITGASLKLRRGVIFVDESAPDAALHEMGHGIGLYTGTEQYDEYPPAGLSVEGLTAFINDESATNSINGFRNRFLHFPRKGQSWYENKYWFDIMGSSTTMIWPIESTFSEFENYFRSTLGTKTKSLNLKNAGVPDGYKRIFVYGSIEKTTGYPPCYKFTPGTISMFDITDIATGKIDVPNEITSNYYVDDDYNLECFDSLGNSIYTQVFTTVSPYKGYGNMSEWPVEGSFCGTFDIPENTEVLKIFQRAWSNGGELIWETDPIFELNRTSSSPVVITSPTSGSQLSEDVEISWSVVETKQAGGQMQYVIMVSTDSGNSWVPFGAPITSTRITIPTDFLPSSDNIIFKVIGSNGLNATEDEVGGLVMQNRPPKAIIKSPENGWIGEQGTRWILKGYGVDNEDGTIPGGIWTSSIDGQLNTETEIILSPGVHRLTFTVTDSGGLTDEDSVEVEVRQTQDMEIDLAISEDNLSIQIPTRDPLNTSPVVWLEKDKIHRAILKIRNTGADTIFTASIYLTKPTGPEQLLTQNIFSPDAFDEVVLSETFIVEEKGRYQIRAEITDITPQDINSLNNEKTWIYQTKPDEPVIYISPDTLDFGSARAKKQGFILIKNYGNADLMITSLVISGTNPNEFSVDKSILQTPIPPDNSILLPVYFNPATKGTKNAILTITSNDTQNQKTINLTGICLSISGDISNDGTIDISDVILCLRQAIGLDQQTLDSADMNEDGEIDITDVILILRKAIGLD